MKIQLLRHCLITDNVKPDLAGTVMEVGKDLNKDRADALITAGYAKAIESKDKAAAPENKGKGK